MDLTALRLIAMTLPNIIALALLFRVVAGLATRFFNGEPYKALRQRSAVDRPTLAWERLEC